MSTYTQDILIIEDDDLFFYALKPRLERKGFNVTRAKDGKDGLARCKRGNYSLVITDIVMPKMNGFEVIKALRKDYNKKYAIIVVSNLGSSLCKTDKEFLNSLGITRYLLKSNHSITDIANSVVECLK